MGTVQGAFVTEFREALVRRFGAHIQCGGGQGKANCGQLPPNPELRRLGRSRANETFELGDLRADLAGQTVIMEFESEWVAVHNLVKYWPFVRGELNTKPILPITLCHFSSWSSYGSYRDLWKWIEARMANDPLLVMGFRGRQFDHGGEDQQLRANSIAQAMSWLAEGIQDGRPAI